MPAASVRGVPHDLFVDVFVFGDGSNGVKRLSEEAGNAIEKSFHGLAIAPGAICDD